MNELAYLLSRLGTIQDADRKIKATAKYLSSIDSGQRSAIILKVLSGNVPKRIIQHKKLQSWANDIIEMPEWLIERSYAEVSTSLEAFSLLLHSTELMDANPPSLEDILQEIKSYRNENEIEVQSFLKEKVASWPSEVRNVVLKIITGSFSPPLTEYQLMSSIGMALGITAEKAQLRRLLYPDRIDMTLDDFRKTPANEQALLPDSFPNIMTIDSIDECAAADFEMVFGKENGLEVQLVKYADRTLIWTKEGELVSEKFPEIIDRIPDAYTSFKCYGQVLCKNSDGMDVLESRMAKKNISNKDIRANETFFQLWSFLDDSVSKFEKQFVHDAGWRVPNKDENLTKNGIRKAQDECRARGFSGLVLREKVDQFYLLSAKAYSANAVLMYVEFGGFENKGIKSLTMGLQEGQHLVSVAKVSQFDASFNLEEIIEFVRSNTLERFGPVRTVPALLTYQLLFDEVRSAPRKKAKVNLKNPRIVRSTGKDGLGIDALSAITSLLKKGNS